MGIRIGGRVGPVSVSASPRGCLPGCGAGLILLAIAAVIAGLAAISPALGAVGLLLIPLFFIVQFIVALVRNRRR